MKILLMLVLLMYGSLIAAQDNGAKTKEAYLACTETCDEDGVGDRNSCLDGCGKVQAMSSNEWQHTIKVMPVGNAEPGQKLYTDKCSNCHGKQGIPDDRKLPVLAGQRQLYIYKMLLDYRDNRMNGMDENAATMASVAAGLVEADMANLAAWLSSLPRPTASTESGECPKVLKGDHSRLLPPCESCHGANGQGWGVQPALVGQNKAFLLDTLKRFHDGKRSNDINEGMARFAAKLTEEEMQAITKCLGR